MKSKSTLSFYLLCLFGFILTGIGIYFIFFRPQLLPEDIRFMGLNESQEQSFRDLASPWLKEVFRVMGGYIVSSGTLFIFLAFKSFREFETWSWFTAMFAGFSSIGTMAVLNFKIRSDFRWWILLLSLIWVSAILLNLFEKQKLTTKTTKEKEHESK